MIKKIVIIPLLISHIALGYNDLEEYTKKLSKIDKIERDLNILQKQFYRSGNSKNKQDLNIESQFNNNIEIKISNIEERLRSLIGDIEKLEHDIIVQDNKFKKFAEDIEFRFNELNEQNTKESVENFTKEIPPAPNLEVKLSNPEAGSLGKVKLKDTEKLKQEITKRTDSTQEEFEEAFELLKANKYIESEQKFKKIVEQDNKEDITARSLYWIGEIYTARKNYEQAAIYFLQSYKKLPKHKRAVESLIRLVSTLRILKKNSEACAIIAKIDKEFSNLSEKLSSKLEEEKAKQNCN